MLIPQTELKTGTQLHTTRTVRVVFTSSHRAHVP